MIEQEYENNWNNRGYSFGVGSIKQEWLPNSGEKLGDFPRFFHYLNVGHDVTEEEMVTDVYLPLQ